MISPIALCWQQTINRWWGPVRSTDTRTYVREFGNETLPLRLSRVNDDGVSQLRLIEASVAFNIYRVSYVYIY